MKKKKYDRPFVEVLMLETSGGMMKASPNFVITEGEHPDNGILKSKKNPTSSDSQWEDDSEIENDDMGYKSYD